eukprot:7026763-Alexandrium_andersonii.AAC.1
MPVQIQVCKPSVGAVDGSADDSHHLPDQQRRHTLWVKRKSREGQRASWRPAKRHRVASKNTL